MKSPTLINKVSAGIVSLMVTPLVFAHPGHGLGPVGHDLQHMAWNFFTILAVGAVLMLAERLPALRRKRSDRDDDV